jgi:hypothetical protein
MTPQQDTVVLKTPIEEKKKKTISGSMFDSVRERRARPGPNLDQIPSGSAKAEDEA